MTSTRVYGSFMKKENMTQNKNKQKNHKQRLFSENELFNVHSSSKVGDKAKGKFD